MKIKYNNNKTKKTKTKKNDQTNKTNIGKQNEPSIAATFQFDSGG